MRELIGWFAVLFVVLPVLGAGAPAPMAVEDTVKLTGCLKAGDEEGSFHLDPVTQAPEGVDIEKAELVPAEGVNLQAHVGHEVEVTGEKIEAGGVREGEHRHGHGEADKKAARLKVSGLKHISASCGS